MYTVAAVALIFAAHVRAFDVTEEEEAEDVGEARLGYITVASDGSTSLTFNAFAPSLSVPLRATAKM